MPWRQFRVLARDFLFSVIDIGLLSAHAKGDASRLLAQITALLICVSVCLCIPAFTVDPDAPVVVRLAVARAVVRLLIATTMLVVGLLTVLSWHRIFPSLEDVRVLGPLPIRPHTILLAKAGALITALSVAVLALHIATGAIWPLVLTTVARDRDVRVPVYTYDAAMPPVRMADLPAMLRQDLHATISHGSLAPGAGGGLVIGLSHRGERQVFAFGTATPDAIFQIGSATKPFTGILLAYMVETGRTRFDEPVRWLLPDAGLSPAAAREITVLDLATHHSGLPSLPARLRPSNTADPLADFDVSRLYAFLASRGMAARPDAPFQYSNVGFGLLGHALGRRAGMDYAELLRFAVSEPLGLHDTVVRLSPAQQPRVIQGYDDDGRAIAPMHFAALAGAGALYSTAPDLLAWLEMHLHPERVADPTLAAAIRASHRPRATIDARTAIGLAWTLHRDTSEVEHGGSLRGFTADTFFNPREDIAGVVLANIGPGTAVSAETVGAHLRARLAGRPAATLAAVTMPQTGDVRAWLRLLVAYWLTMVGAGACVFGLAVSLHGLAAATLPRAVFVQVSPWLQFVTFAGVVGGFCLAPIGVTPTALRDAQAGGLWAMSPALWFLGLFQHLSGVPALPALARQAWVALGLALCGAGGAYALAYRRILTQIAEQPDSAAPSRGGRWVPTWGSALSTALVNFSVRTARRSAPHRLILTFYWGLGFAVSIVLIKSPRGQQLAEVSGATAWHETGVPILVSSVVMMAFAVVAARIAFAMPRELPANWIFRLVPVHEGRHYVQARRRALIVASVVPVCAVYAALLVTPWPWSAALGHLVALALLGLILVELALVGPMKIPATCSYLPGRSQVHLAVLVATVVLLPLAFKAAAFELEALQAPASYARMLAGLALAWAGLRARGASAARGPDALPRFEDEPSELPVALELWDSRIPNAARSASDRATAAERRA